MPAWDRDKAHDYYLKNRDNIRKKRRSWYKKKKEEDRETVLVPGKGHLASKHKGTS